LGRSSSFSFSIWLNDMDNRCIVIIKLNLSVLQRFRYLFALNWLMMAESSVRQGI
jgi:hypothetical protein